MPDGEVADTGALDASNMVRYFGQYVIEIEKPTIGLRKKIGINCSGRKSIHIDSVLVF
ncbi:MAG: hypothetical protein R3F51_19190 [Cyanobacteriota/Melainabacteria group bacterium]